MVKRGQANLSAIKAEEKKIEREEKLILKEERAIEKKEKEIEELEKKLERRLKGIPLTRFTLKDLTKSAIGAVAGVVGHFAFLKGADVAGHIDVFRATAILALSYFLGYILMYKAGYRKIIEHKLFGIFPFRATTIFLTSLFVIVVILFLFGALKTDFVEAYKQVAVISVVAMLGAGIADLTGGE